MINLINDSRYLCIKILKQKLFFIFMLSCLCFKWFLSFFKNCSGNLDKNAWFDFLEIGFSIDLSKMNSGLDLCNNFSRSWRRSITSGTSDLNNSSSSFLWFDNMLDNFVMFLWFAPNHLNFSAFFLMDIDDSLLFLLWFQYFLDSFFSCTWLFNIYDSLLMSLRFQNFSDSFFSFTWLVNFNHSLLMSLWFYYCFIFSGCRSWLFDFSDNFLMLLWLNHLNFFSRCTLWDFMNNISNLFSLWKNLFNNFSWSTLRNFLDNISNLLSLGKDFFNYFCRSTLWLFLHNFLNSLFLRQMGFNYFGLSTCRMSHHVLSWCLFCGTLLHYLDILFISTRWGAVSNLLTNNLSMTSWH